MSQPADQPVQQALEFPKDVSADYETERKAFVVCERTRPAR